MEWSFFKKFPERGQTIQDFQIEMQVKRVKIQNLLVEVVRRLCVLYAETRVYEKLGQLKIGSSLKEHEDILRCREELRSAYNLYLENFDSGKSAEGVN